MEDTEKEQDDNNSQQFGLILSDSEAVPQIDSHNAMGLKITTAKQKETKNKPIKRNSLSPSKVKNHYRTVMKWNDLIA